ncbi:MAG: type II toxin-antitoxin system mRNA interferase toxin, RelE/StbE family [Nitrospirae bacterium]|nr:type II toxin-antitoxin system mRNA interferase toxin, RelE/StbE family [Nitrospirota bacterium]
MQIKAKPPFLKQANKLFKKNPYLKKEFEVVIEKLTLDPFDPSLKTHKLSGELKDFWSCHITYTIRLSFKYKKGIVELIDIGTHQEIYNQT